MAVLTAAKGLITNPNELSNPNGSLHVADNVNIDADNIIQKRRGYKEYATLSSQAKQLLTYKNVVIAHYADKLAYDLAGNGTFVDFAGTYSEIETGLRIKGIEANGNFYFTTNKGVQKISAKTTADIPSGSITRSGGIKAVDLSSSTVLDAAGFLPPQSKVAYRLVFGTKDANENLIPGYPSPRSISTNTSADVNQSEKFTLTVLNHAGIANSEYFLFDVVDIGYFVWFDKDGSATQPATADTLSRQGVKVSLQGTTTNDEAAAAIANTLAASVEGITVEVSTNQVTVTVNAPGNVSDVAQGTVSASNLQTRKIFDGSITEGSSCSVSLNFTVPQEVTTSYFYQVYRTAVSTVTAGVTLSDIDPGDEMQFILENPVTAADITAGEITVVDNTPEGFRQVGAYLYTNPVTGGGILSANDRPPIATDMALFRNSTFYANTKDVQRLELSVLSVDNFVSGSTKFVIGKGSSVSEYTFVGDVEITDITVQPKSTTVGNSYIKLYAAEDVRKYYLWFDKGIISKSFDSTTDVDDGTDTITVASHGFATNDKVQFSGTAPSGLSTGVDYYIIRTGANTFQVSATISGSAINIATAVGTCTVIHTPADPAVSGFQGIRIPLELYDDTAAGSKQALLDSLVDFSDFAAADTGASVVTITCTDAGSVTDPTYSPVAPGWTFSVVAQGDGEDIVAREALLSVSSSTATAITLTTLSLIKVINRDSDCPVTATYLSGPDDLPGKILIEAKELDNETFYVAVTGTGLASEFNPELPSTAILSSINSTTNVFQTSVNHGFQVGQQVYLHDNPGLAPTEFGGYYKIATVPALNQFTLTGIDVGINQPTITGVVFLATVSSTNNEAPNRIYYSKTSQPEAVPLINYIDVGPKNKKILRILALRDNLFVLKEDGVYIVTGSSAPNFSVRLLDNSTYLIAADTASVLNNLIYGLSNQGIVNISDSGVSVISRNIDDQIRSVTTFAYDYVHTSFAVSYESDRAYVVWLPTTKLDTVATQAFRYNTFTGNWTRWVKTNTCGLVNAGDDRMYLGSGVRLTVEQERKNNERQDYADRDFTLSIGAEAVGDLTIVLSSVTDIVAGDVLTQTQYVNIPKYNRLLKKLDKDGGAADSDYYSTLAISAGANLANALTALVTKLNADTGLTGPFTVPSGSNAVNSLRTDFNTVINELNAPGSGTYLKDYKTADDLLTYEVLVTAVDKNSNKVTVNFNTWFIQGNCQLYKAIRSEMVWAPQHFGTPNETKQIPEGTVLFETNNLYSATVAYSSDRSADFSEVNFTLPGPGTWAVYNWSDVTFGGLGNSVPIRTLVPQNKSRCRYLNVKFKHSNARENFRVLGISLEPRQIGPRGYR